MVCLKAKYAKKNKKQKDQIALHMIASVSSRRCESYRMYLECESYRMYLESDSPHQIVMILCELKVIFSYLKSS